MKKVCLSLLMGLMVQMTFGQTLEKMQWFNEPEQWEIKNSDYPFMHLLYSQLLVCQRVCLQNTVCLICK